MNENAIAVVGLAGRFPGARSLSEFWDNLRTGVESMTSFTDEQLRAAGVPDEVLRNPDYVKSGVVLEGFDLFDAGFFGFSPRDAQIMDPQQRVFLECAWEALEHAGHDPARFPGSIGVFAGSGMTAYMTFNLAPNRSLMDEVGLFLVRHTGNDKDFLATRVSYELDLTGPSLNVQTACSTSLVAIHLATQHLLSGECDMALAGGVTIELPHHVGYLFKQDEILSRDGHCRAFDADSAGTVFGSGAGIVVLRRLADALKDGDHIHAVILGSAVNNDGAAKVGYLAPSVDGQAAAIAEAIGVAGIPAESITYVEAHGTGTPVGDPIEVAALTQAYRGAGATKRGYCALGSVKGNIGHLDTAAGVASFMKAVLALEHRQIPPTLHYRRPNPAIDFASSPFFVPSDVRPWTSNGPRRAGVSSLGVGGTNAHVVLQEAPLSELGTPGRPWQLIVLSARTPTALDNASANLADHLRETETTFADVAWTLQEGRHAFAERRCVVARDRAEAAEAIESNDPTRVFNGRTGRSGAPSVAFMFAGGGAQHPNMARELYASEPVFRRELDRCLDVLTRHVATDLRALLFPPPGEEERASRELERPAYALPLLFAVQFAQAQLWRSWGVVPSAMIGHSMGEYTAACLAGVFTLEDALAVVALRGRLFESLPAGGMISVALPPAELEPLLGPALSLAAVNAPELSVASGPLDALDTLERTLQQRDVETRRIHIAVAAHSAALEPILAEFRAFLSTLRLQAPALPFVSNLSGRTAGDEVADPEYWVRHLRHTVRFSDGLHVLLENPETILLEVGPGRTLATLARLHPAVQPGHGIVTSLPHPDERVSDAAFMLTALGRLWLRGVSVDWNGLHGGERRLRVVLPTYPFERQRHWIDAPRPHADVQTAEGGKVERHASVDDWFWQPVWRRASSSADERALARAGAIIFDGEDTAGIAEAAAATLRAAGERVVTVVAGERFERIAPDRYRVRPGEADDCAALWRELASAGGVPGRMLHLWTVGAPTDATRDRARGFETIAAIAQSLGAEDVGGGTVIVVAGTGSQQVSGESVPSPVRALSHGLLRVVAREYEGFTVRYVDVAGDAAVDGERGVAARLSHELQVRGPDLVAYRGRERFVLDFERLPLGPGDEQAGLRTCGVYLITGGMGGIGSVIARELARRAQARLALVARQPLPPRTDWPLWLATHVDSDDTSRRIRLVMELEDAGAEVLPLAADLGTAEGAARIVEETRRRFGVLHGVVHAAGVLDDGLLQVRTRADRDRVLAPKVDGTLALDTALGAAPLDFFVSFSSVSAFAGLPGQSDYAAANAFLDAYAQQRSARAPGRSVSIAWSAWKDVGMLAADAANRASPETVGAPVSISHPLLKGGVRNGAVDVFSGTLSPDTDWILGEHRLLDGDPLIPGTGYLELARAAFEATAGGGTTEMRDVFFLKPFSVGDGESRELRVRLERSEASATDADFVILGRRVGAASWTEHARGRATRTGSRAPARVAVEVIKARCDAVHDSTEAHPYLTFGPRWENVLAIDYGVREALVSLELPARFASDLAKFPLHPALLDMATAGAQRLIPGHDPSLGFFVPIGYGCVRLEGLLTPRLFSHIRYRPTGGDRADVAIFDVTLTDATGVVVAEISDFTMKRVAAETMRNAERDDAPTTAALVDLADAIAPAEGTTAFFRIIGADTGAHVVVSPQRFDALLQRWRHVQTARPPEPVQPQEDPALAQDLDRITEALRAHPAVADAAAVAKKGRGSERRIIGYVLFKQGEGATISELRRAAKSALPSHLVPANFIDLEELPRLPDGSVDRASLPDPFGPIDNYVAPRTEMEKAVAQVWKEVLGVDRVGVRDNFFDIGGHSLLSVRVITKLDRRLGVRLDQAIMVLQTLEQIAARCEQRLAARPGEEALAR